MINEPAVYAMCKDDISKIENYDKAVKDLTQMWKCHLQDGSLEEKEKPRN